MASETRNSNTEPTGAAPDQQQERQQIMEEPQKSIPVLPVRDTVLFPHAVLPLTVGRESSIQLINSLGEEKTILVVAQREARVDAPQPTDLYSIGTLATVHKVVKMPNQSLFVFTEGLSRGKLQEFTQLTPFLRANVEPIPDAEPEMSPEIEALQRNVLTLFQQIVAGSPTLSDELQTVAINIEEPGRLVDFVASSLPFLSTKDKQEILETPDVSRRLQAINHHLAKELEVQQLRNKIQSEVQDRVQQSQREYYLREQMKAIQKELGDGDDQQREFSELKEKIEKAGMPEEAKKEALRELDRLSRMSPAAAEYTVARTYLDWLVALPWSKRTEGEIDLVGYVVGSLTLYGASFGKVQLPSGEFVRSPSNGTLLKSAPIFHWCVPPHACIR
jgi:ATP-dependent Lon protease